MKSHANGGFCWPSRSSSGVDSVVNSHTQPCGHFIGCTKKPENQTTNRRWKEEIDKHGFRTAKLRKVKSGTFKHSVCISRELCENPTQLPEMLTHLAIVFIALS